MKDQLRNLLIRFHNCENDPVIPLRQNSETQLTVKKQRVVNQFTNKRSGYKEFNSHRNN